MKLAQQLQELQCAMGKHQLTDWGLVPMSYPLPHHDKPDNPARRVDTFVEMRHCHYCNYKEMRGYWDAQRV